MARRSRLFSLSALTRAYQRNLKALVRATRPAPAKRRKAVAAKPLLKDTPATARRSAAGAPRAAARKPRSVAPAEWVAGVAPGPAGARRYHLFVPPGLAPLPGETFPLLVMLHGCGQTGRDLAASSRMNRLAARERFLVLYPEQERVANAHGCWNWFERRNGKADAEAATLLAAVDKVAKRYPVDLSRVAVAGLSAGASMAVLMAALYPHRFCAVAMHSGVAPGTAESAATAIAAMHGRRDAHLPVAILPQVPTQAAAAAGAPYSARRSLQRCPLAGAARRCRWCRVGAQRGGHRVAVGADAGRAGRPRAHPAARPAPRHAGDGVQGARPHRGGIARSGGPGPRLERRCRRPLVQRSGRPRCVSAGLGLCGAAVQCQKMNKNGV